MIALALAAALIGPVQLQKPMDPYRIANVVGLAGAVNMAPPEAFKRVGDHPGLGWYSAGYFPVELAEDWGRDTLEVVTHDGRRFRAVEQFAMTPDLKVVRLSGRVSNTDLQRKPLRKGVGVVLFLAFRERFPLRSVAVVRLGGGP